MLEDLNARIEETKRRLAIRDELQQSLPQQHERLDQEGFHRRRLEVALDLIGQEIQELESLSLGLKRSAAAAVRSPGCLRAGGLQTWRPDREGTQGESSHRASRPALW